MDGTLSRTAKLFAIVLMAVSFIAASAQTPADNSTISRTSSDKTIPRIDSANLRIDPVAQVRIHKSWEYGPFVNGGIGVGERSQYKFLWAGYSGGQAADAGLSCRHLQRPIRTGWQHHAALAGLHAAPRIKQIVHLLDAMYNSRAHDMPGGRRHIPRRQPDAGDLALEFLTRSQPHSALVSGRGRADLHHPQVSAELSEFPARRSDGGTCVWNFSPQGGFGIHYFTRARRSIDLGVNAVHISSASLGDRNPGVNASVQVQLGYTFWK